MNHPPRSLLPRPGLGRAWYGLCGLLCSLYSALGLLLTVFPPEPTIFILSCWSVLWGALGPTEATIRLTPRAYEWMQGVPAGLLAGAWVGKGLVTMLALLWWVHCCWSDTGTASRHRAWVALVTACAASSLLTFVLVWEYAHALGAWNLFVQFWAGVVLASLWTVYRIAQRRPGRPEDPRKE